VVGVDGSEGSRQALLWAADEASLRGADLEVIHTYEPMQNVGSTGSAAQAEKLFEAAGKAARELVGGMTVAIGGVEVEGHALESLDPAQTLVERSRGTDMLVVSSRGLGSFRSLLLGSVSHQCAAERSSTNLPGTPLGHVVEVQQGRLERARPRTAARTPANEPRLGIPSPIGTDRGRDDPPGRERPDRSGRGVSQVSRCCVVAEGGGFEPPRDVTPNTDSSRAP
jgi:nucleotide-binding universal stress UspA family protein